MHAALPLSLVAAALAAAALAGAAPAAPVATTTARPGAAGAAPEALVDPRAGGLTVGLGEWAIAPEAPAIRPGRVTLVVRNGGRVAHGLRIKQETRRHGGDRFKTRTVVLRPGGTTRFTVRLGPGVYSLECFVEDHGDLGMERRFEVRPNAPLVRPPAAGRAVGAIAGFAFRPATIAVTVGTSVRWTNEDAAPHTVTATAGSFASKELGRGGTYVRRFDRPGTFAYLCALHPAMRGRVVVTAR